jgi:hypothetical protein
MNVAPAFTYVAPLLSGQVGTDGLEVEADAVESDVSVRLEDDDVVADEVDEAASELNIWVELVHVVVDEAEEAEVDVSIRLELGRSRADDMDGFGDVPGRDGWSVAGDDDAVEDVVLKVRAVEEIEASSEVEGLEYVDIREDVEVLVELEAGGDGVNAFLGTSRYQAPMSVSDPFASKNVAFGPTLETSLRKLPNHA